MTQIAVIDVETTGLNPYRNDRIIEIAAVIISPEGAVVREFDTLINPERDIGPTQIHGLTTEDVITAPLFHEVAGSFIEAIDGCVALAGHNFRFDYSFLSAEFDRFGFKFPEVPTLCTMRLAGGGSLEHCCATFGIHPPGNAHSARYDAHAAAQLLALLLEDTNFEESEIFSGPNIIWPKVPKLPCEVVARNGNKKWVREQPDFLRKLLKGPRFNFSVSNLNEALVDYTNLLNQVLEDRVISSQESEALVDLALKWGLSPDHIKTAHYEFISLLAKQAWADGVITDAERRDLNRVASLLGIAPEELVKITNLANQESTRDKRIQKDDQSWLVGQTVCFTGECQCELNGERITRSRSFGLAEAQGLVVSKRVTKSVDILVVADPLTQSGKAKMARKYGTRIIQARVFWRAIGVEVT